MFFHFVLFFHSSSHSQLKSLEYPKVSYGCIGSSLLQGLFSSCSKLELLCSCSAQASHWSGFSCCRAPALEHRFSSCGAWLSCSEACGILWDRGSNPCPLHWQVDSLALSHQGSPCPRHSRQLTSSFVFLPYTQGS